MRKRVGSQVEKTKNKTISNGKKEIVLYKVISNYGERKIDIRISEDASEDAYDDEENRYILP